MLMASCAAPQVQVQEPQPAVITVSKNPEPTPSPRAVAVKKPKAKPMKTLTEEEFVDAFMKIASKYEFHIPNGAMSGFNDKVKVDVFTPSALEAMANGQIRLSTSKITLKKVGDKIYQVENGVRLEVDGRKPKLCVTPEAVGGKFPPELACENLPGLGADRYSLISILPLYLLGKFMK